MSLAEVLEQWPEDVMGAVPTAGSLPEGFQALSEDSVESFLVARHPNLVADFLGGLVTSVREISDGNLNHVFEVTGKDGKRICVKQALPFMRMNEDIKMAAQRIYFENASLRIFSHVAAEERTKIVPDIYAFDKDMMVVIMEFVAPHQVLRSLLVNGFETKGLGSAVGRSLARILFATSIYGLEGPHRRRLMNYFAQNNDLCVATEEAVFTSPLVDKPSFTSRWTSPALDEIVTELRADKEVLLAVADLKTKFSSQADCLLHGDTHTGSILANPESQDLAEAGGSVLFIDSEFTLMGPIAFDVGSFMGNLVISACARRSVYPLTELQEFWQAFAQTFKDMWTRSRKEFLASLENSPERLETGRISVYFRKEVDVDASQALKTFFRDLWFDAVGFAAVELIRRTIGVAHVEDFESIRDIEERAYSESSALKIAQTLLHDRRSEQQIKNPEDLLALCKLKLGLQPAVVTKTATIFLVARLPRLGSCKTRLASTIGNEAALDFAQACIGDLIESLGDSALEESLQANIQRVILFSPGEDKQDYRTWLDAAFPKHGPRWELQSMSTQQGEPDVRLGKLGNALGGSLQRCHSDAVAFIGMDTPNLGINELSKALAIPLAEPSKAFLSPALDGGYVLLALPGHCGKEAFWDVAWSTGAAFATQLNALTECGLRVTIGKEVFRDVDEEDDYLALAKDLKENQTYSCERLRNHFTSHYTSISS